MTSQESMAPVSVVIPCYRCSLTIGRALASIAQQSMKPVEVILVDDASGDDTWVVLTKLATAYPVWVRLIQLETNLGAASARNAGWAAASQPFIAFLDADDSWHPEKIAIQYDYMKRHPEVVLSGHRHRVLARMDAKPEWALLQGPTKFIDKWPLLLGNPFITPSAMLRTDIPQRFAEGRRYMEDHLLWLEIVCDGAKIVRLDVDLAITPQIGISTCSTTRSYSCTSGS